MSWISTEGRSTLGWFPTGFRKEGSEILGNVNIANLVQSRGSGSLVGNMSDRVAPASLGYDVPFGPTMCTRKVATDFMRSPSS